MLTSKLFVVYFLTIASVILLTCSAFVYAAPSLTIIVENAETHECAFYNAGDEFYRNKLPSGWTPSLNCNNNFIYNSDENETLTLESYLSNIRACCEKQGYIFIEKDVGKNAYSFEGFWLRITQRPKDTLILLAFIAVFAFAIIKYIQIAKKYRKNKNKQ